MFLIVLALLPAIALAVWIYRQDKIEREPRKLLWKIFFLGVLSVIPTIILELILGDVVGLFFEETSVAYIVLDNFICVAVVEEYWKMKAAKKAAWKDPAFNYKFDAIVYCVTSALGFAAIENVIYVMDGGLDTAISRMLLSVPSHAIDGVIMGYFFGMAKEADLKGDKKRRKQCLRRSVFVPAIEHGIYDTSLSLDSDWLMLFFLLFVIVIDIWAYRFVKKQARQDRELVHREAEPVQMGTEFAQSGAGYVQQSTEYVQLGTGYVQQSAEPMQQSTEIVS